MDPLCKMILTKEAAEIPATIRFREQFLPFPAALEVTTSRHSLVSFRSLQQEHRVDGQELGTRASREMRVSVYVFPAIL